jgi:ParB family transcriptional regulator, chromosome partitioning protein
MSRAEGRGGMRGGLGRGLDALIPRGANGPQELELGRIEPNPQQPRQHFDPVALEELAESIRAHGVLQPVIVHRSASGYTLIAGERRWRAAQLAGLRSIPAIVKEASGQDVLELALVENLQRADLTPLEEAAAYRELVDAHGLTQDQVAQRVGRSRVGITNRLRLLSLPDGARTLLAEGAITEGHARALLGCADAALIDRLAAQVARQQLSVRQTEELVRRISEPKEDRQGARPEPTEVEEELQRDLGTRVQLMRSRRGGRLVIHYYDDQQLDGLIERLRGRDDS